MLEDGFTTDGCSGGKDVSTGTAAIVLEDRFTDGCSGGNNGCTGTGGFTTDGYSGSEDSPIGTVTHVLGDKFTDSCSGDKEYCIGTGGSSATQSRPSGNELRILLAGLIVITSWFHSIS